MSKKALTINFVDGKPKQELVELVVDESPINVEKQSEVSYSVKAVDEKITNINEGIDGIEQVIVQQVKTKSYQNSILNILETLEERDNLTIKNDGDRYIVGKDIHVYHQETNTWEIIIALHGMSVVNLTNDIEYYFDNTSWIEKLGDSSLVHTEGDETIGGNKLFLDNITVTKDLVINQQISTMNPTIVLNKGKQLIDKAGLEIERGTEEKVNLIFDEHEGIWKAGFEGNEQPVGVIDDAIASNKKVYSSEKVDELLQTLSLTIGDIAQSINEPVYFEAAENIEKNELVYLDNEGKIRVADNKNVNIASKVIGMSPENKLAGDICAVLTDLIMEGFVNLSPGKIIYVGENGDITDTINQDICKVVVKAGYTIDQNKILLNIGDSIIL